MISIRTLSRGSAEAVLLSYGCQKLQGLGPLNTAEWWQWPWGGTPFTLPFEDGAFVDQWALQRLLADMARLAPDNWVFPDDAMGVLGVWHPPHPNT